MRKLVVAAVAATLALVACAPQDEAADTGGGTPGATGCERDS